MSGADVLAPVRALPDAARRELCLALLADAGAGSIRVNDTTGEIVHGCLMTPGAHRDQQANPTASINYKRLAASCFGCRAAGGLTWFIATVLRTDDDGARAWLSGRGPAPGAVMPLATLLSAINLPFQSAATAPEQLPRYDPAILATFDHPHSYWTDAPAPPGMPGGGRGVAAETVTARCLGYDPGAGRVVIPHLWEGELVGWQTRPAGPVPPGMAKYLNSPSFPRQQTLYGFNPQAEEILLVESASSVLRHAHAFDDISATFGAIVTDAQIRAVVRSRHIKRVIVWPDADTKGWDALDGGGSPEHGLIRRISPYLPVLVVDSPFSGDPGDIDTPTAAVLRERYTVPAALWRRPAALSCWHCEEPAHSGCCRTTGGTP